MSSSKSSPVAGSAGPPSENLSLSISSSPAKAISPPPSAAKPKNSQPPASTPQNLTTRPLSDVIGEAFPPFDHQTIIVTPFNHELNRDSVFEKELNSMLLNATLEMHAWAATRPKHESSIAAQNIEQKIVSVMETEKQQDKTRQQLNQFVTQLKNALAALTGLTGM